MPRNPAIAVLARAPSSGGKTRLAGQLAPDTIAALRLALVSDALAVASSTRFPVHVFVTPDDRVDEVRALAPDLVYLPQRGRDLGARMANGVADVLESGADTAIVIGTDIPLLSPADLKSAADLASDGVLVLGPATDGGYYLIATTKLAPALFEGVVWGTGHVCRDTIVRAEAEGLDIALLRKLTDLDTLDDLESIRADLASLPEQIAPALRGWLADNR